MQKREFHGHFKVFIDGTKLHSVASNTSFSTGWSDTTQKRDYQLKYTLMYLNNAGFTWWNPTTYWHRADLR